MQRLRTPLRFLSIRHQSSNASARNAQGKDAKRPLVRKGLVSPMQAVPDSIVPTPYLYTGQPQTAGSTFTIHNADTIRRMRHAGKIARQTLTFAGSLVRPGITTESIDIEAHKFMLAKDACPSPLNYFGFPKSICTSVNEVICHGIPDDRGLRDGDILKIDVSVYVDGVHGDCCHTFHVGHAPDEAGKKLVSTTQECLHMAIAACGPNVPFNEIGRIISSHAYSHGFGVCSQYTGHGIGQHLHMYPNVFHVANSFSDKMKPGMTFTIEPMVTEGDAQEDVWDDHWTVVTRDGSRAAQFEHTVLITETGCEVLTI